MSSREVLSAYGRLREAVFEQLLVKGQASTAECQSDFDRRRVELRESEERVAAALHELEDVDA